MSECKSCKAKILWVKTENGKNMPVDLKPIRIYVPGEFFALLNKDDKKYSADTYVQIEGHVPHWGTCPTAALHRKQKKEEAKCEYCDGHGEVCEQSNLEDDSERELVKCEKCNGTGKGKKYVDPDNIK